MTRQRWALYAAIAALASVCGLLLLLQHVHVWVVLLLLALMYLYRYDGKLEERERKGH
jgi:1,4-dihydroxy-2-naphthoate octaprenyltransferase